MKRTIVIVFFLAILFPVMAQEDFYAAGKTREIRIRFREPAWRHILDSLFEHSGDAGKLPGDVTIDGHFLPNAGIRYKGYSSYNADEIKNPFNIDLDYSVTNQNHLGHVKLKLSNVIHDPSFIREVLSYEIARKYLPASRANFANLYVNDTLIGLYTNVEAVDQNFTEEHWGSHKNSFFKGEPLKLQYPFGQNANLALTHGTDSSGYMAYYNMESDAGWNDLFNLINRLDQGADSAASVLNIDQVLWMHAFNEVLLNLDSYVGYAQNYYLYCDGNRQFNPILWDMNMSFGSFRETDASTHFQGLSIPELEQLDPLALMDFAVSPRPLMTRLFCNDTLRKMYFAHMRTILDDNFSNGWYFSRGQELQAQIDADVRTDTNRFYSYADFLKNITEPVGGTGTMKEYPGIKALMEARLAYLGTRDGFSGQPVITSVAHLPDVPVKNQECWITATIQGSSMALLNYRFSTGGLFSTVAMADDGNHHDGIAGDGIFGAMIIADGHTIQFYIYAQNELAGVFSPGRAAHEFHAIQPMILPGDVVLNEVYAGSVSGSWIELLNTTTEPLNLVSMQLSDDPDSPDKWELPDTVLGAKQYLLIHASGGSGKPAAPGALSASGGALLLSNASGLRIDSIGYAYQVNGKSTGRYPNGFGAMTYMIPSKGGFNSAGTTPGTGFLLYPNPAAGMICIELTNSSGIVNVTIYNGIGEPVMEKDYFYSAGQSGPVVQPIDVTALSSGMYEVRVCTNEAVTVKKLVLY